MLIKYIFSIFLYTPYVCIICSTSHYSELSIEYFHITICFMDPSKFLYVCPFYLICPTYSISPFMYILFDISFYVYIQYLYICPIYSMSLYMPHQFDILIVALLTRYLFLCTIYSVFSSFPIYSISTFLDYLFEVFPISPLIYYSIFPISLSVGDVSQSKIW